MPAFRPIRRARSDEFEALAALERAAFTIHGTAFYPLADIECALEHFEGLQRRLIEEGHYFVIETETGTLAASGGWSRSELEYLQASPAPDRGKTGVVRCVFVAPPFAGLGLARDVMRHVEVDAMSTGMAQLTLTASKTAEALYRKAGYSADTPLYIRLPNGSDLPLFPMRKQLGLSEV